MRPSNNLENKTPSDKYLGGQLSMYESSGSHFFRTTPEIQSRPGAFDESMFVITFSIILGVTEILCSFRLELEGKTGKITTSQITSLLKQMDCFIESMDSGCDGWI